MQCQPDIYLAYILVTLNSSLQIKNINSNFSPVDLLFCQARMSARSEVAPWLGINIMFTRRHVRASVMGSGGEEGALPASYSALTTQP